MRKPRKKSAKRVKIRKRIKPGKGSELKDKLGVEGEDDTWMDTKVTEDHFAFLQEYNIIPWEEEKDEILDEILSKEPKPKAEVLDPILEDDGPESEDEGDDDPEKEDRPDWLKPRWIWYAYPPKEVEKIEGPASFVMCMNTNTQPCSSECECEDTVRRLQLAHTDQYKQPDIRYNFLIGEDGNVYEGRGWGVQPSLPNKYAEYNNRSMVIGVVGDFTGNDLPRLIREVRDELVDYGIERNFIKKDFTAVEIFDKVKASF